MRPSTPPFVAFPPVISRSLNTTETLAVPVPSTSKIRVLPVDGPEIFVAEGDAPRPSIVNDSATPELFAITTCA